MNEEVLTELLDQSERIIDKRDARIKDLEAALKEMLDTHGVEECATGMDTFETVICTCPACKDARALLKGGAS